jgi:hypothetical protein
MLSTERVGQSCVLASPAFERVALPTLTADGRRAPALRFGDPRVTALLGALCFARGAVRFTHRSLRARVNHLLGAAYNTNQMSYDLGRLRLNGLNGLNGLIERREHTNTYDLDPRRPTRRGVLHQGPRPSSPSAAGRRPPTRTARAPPGPDHHRRPCSRLHRPGPTGKGSLKTQDQRRSLRHQGSLDTKGR